MYTPYTPRRKEKKTKKKKKGFFDMLPCHFSHVTPSSMTWQTSQISHELTKPVTKESSSILQHSQGI
jgi:hypothetical protein